MQGSLPYRYARALVALAQERDQLEEMSVELIRLQGISRQIDRLDYYLAEIVIPRKTRRKTLDQVLDNLLASEMLRRFCHTLLERERFTWFEAIVSAYQDLCDEIAGLLRVKVISAIPLEKDLASKLEAILQDKTGMEVEIDYSEDASLIGGLIIHVGGRVYDGSVRGDLLRAQEKILKGSH